MKKMVDYKCTYGNYLGFDKEYITSMGLSVPELFFNAEDIADYAIAEKERTKGGMVNPVVDSSLLAEALGGILTYDDSPLGPRKKMNVVAGAEDILTLPNLDVSKGRIATTFEAADILRARGEKVRIEVRGIFDTLNSLMELGDVMMVCVREPDLMQRICDRIRKDIVQFAQEAAHHCDLLEYADGSGGINCIGPKMMRKVVKWFTYPLMRDFEEAGLKVQLCPKTAFALVGSEMAEYVRIPTEEGEPFYEAVRKSPEEAKLFGNMCNCSVGRPVGNHIDYLRLK